MHKIGHFGYDRILKNVIFEIITRAEWKIYIYMN